MRSVLLVLLFAYPVRAQVPMGGITAPGNTGQSYTLVQSTNQVACTTPCAVTVTSTGSAHLLVIDATTSANSSYVSNATAGACTGSWTFPSASHATDTGNHISSSYGYCLNSASGQTSITVTLGSNGTVRIWEYSSTNTPTFDTCNIKVTSSAATTQPGATLTLSGSSDVILQVAITPQSISGVSSPYGNLKSGGRASADNENTSSGTAPTWTLTASGNTTTAGCAFQ